MNTSKRLWGILAVLATDCGPAGQRGTSSAGGSGTSAGGSGAAASGSGASASGGQIGGTSGPGVTTGGTGASSSGANSSGSSSAGPTGTTAASSGSGTAGASGGGAGSSTAGNSAGGTSGSPGGTTSTSGGASSAGGSSGSSGAGSATLAGPDAFASPSAYLVGYHNYDTPGSSGANDIYVDVADYDACDAGASVAPPGEHLLAMVIEDEQGNLIQPGTFTPTPDGGYQNGRPVGPYLYGYMYDLLPDGGTVERHITAGSTLTFSGVASSAVTGNFSLNFAMFASDGGIVSQTSVSGTFDAPACQ